MMGWYGNGWNATGIVGMVMMIAVWGSLIAAAVWAIARFTRSERPAQTIAETPRVILDRRFAAGDITAEDYAQSRRLLEGQASTADQASAQ